MERPKYYCLDMFPYPSGEGLHVGHWRVYTLGDMWSRFQVLRGHDVLHPMGWDAFGLPAENAAIKRGEHPEAVTRTNIAHIKAEFAHLGAMFDWSREFATCDPAYYRWTQWIFLKMHERGLAYQAEMPINWCPSCRTGLANEEVVAGACDRCGTPVEKRQVRQWILRITAYADRLLDDLERLDWPERVKKMQADWIGRSRGAQVRFATAGGDAVAVFTTRPDTLPAATFLALAPEHPLLARLTAPGCATAVQAYVQATQRRGSVERMASLEKTGVFTGTWVRHPLTGEDLPVWVADYVLMEYGTGAVIGVPTCDERDAAFAAACGLPGSDRPLFPSVAAAMAALQATGCGEAVTGYKMRDWVFSRQRYWGEPIPIVHCAVCGEVPVPEEQLPVLLPPVERYQPTGTGESPLAAISEWVNVPCPRCGGPGRRETNTMPQWAGSCWYFIRYADMAHAAAGYRAPDGRLLPWDPAAVGRWLPVDLYVGGIEHAVLHLLYARFYTKFLFDLGVIPFDEPFRRLFSQGMICKDGAKMSKSKGNGVSPGPLVARFGADALRLYKMFIAPPEVDVDWQETGVPGMHRFLQRLRRLVAAGVALPAAGAGADDAAVAARLDRRRQEFVAAVTARMEAFHLNTAVSALMEYANDLAALPGAAAPAAYQRALQTLVICLAPFAPESGEAFWRLQGGAGDGPSGSVFSQRWPEPAALAPAAVTLVVQVNGRRRATLQVPADAPAAAAEKAARSLPAVAAVVGDAPCRVVYVPGRVLNLVTAP